MTVRAALAITCFAAAFPAYYLLKPSSLEKGMLAGAQSWSPTREQISSKLSSLPVSDLDARKAEFVRQFQDRYRDRHVAIGIRFSEGNRIRLQCASMIPNYETSKIAITLHEDALAALGSRYEVDILETYISLPPIKRGELRWRKEDGRLTVVYSDTFAGKP